MVLHHYMVSPLMVAPQNGVTWGGPLPPPSYATELTTSSCDISSKEVVLSTHVMMRRSARLTCCRLPFIQRVEQLPFFRLLKKN